MSLEKQLIDAGVRNLREFGYPDCTAENILTDKIYGQFFASMLNDNEGKGGESLDAAIASLRKRIKGVKYAKK